VHKLSLQPNTPDKNKRKKREKVEMSWGSGREEKEEMAIGNFSLFFFGSFEFKIISDQFFFLMGLRSHRNGADEGVWCGSRRGCCGSRSSGWFCLRRCE
jgi:hypothetical protein